jgi:hypothetical protein
VPREGHHHESQWLQKFFFEELWDPIIDELSPPASEELEVVDPEEYYEKGGHDGKGLRVPANLDQSICCYIAISAGNRAKFDRATFWLELASRQWDTSVSTSFAALVSAIESLTERGSIHQFKCPTCGDLAQHEEPGATRRFKDFFDTYATGAALEKRRNDMYSIRSGILHGSDLMQFDQDLAFGWEPPRWNERDLHSELWGLTRVALCNSLKNLPA